jgi:hypothetical protein
MCTHLYLYTYVYTYVCTHSYSPRQKLTPDIVLSILERTVQLFSSSLRPVMTVLVLTKVVGVLYMDA